MVILLTSLWIVLAVVDSKSQHLQRRRQWFALLFAPFGAMLRWKLSLLNGSVAGLKWFPSGTLAANLLACCVDFGLQVNYLLPCQMLKLFSNLGFFVLCSHHQD